MTTPGKLCLHSSRQAPVREPGLSPSRVSDTPSDFPTLHALSRVPGMVYRKHTPVHLSTATDEHESHVSTWVQRADRRDTDAALFTTAKTWNQPKCPSTDDWIRKMWYIYTVEYYSAMKKNETMPFAAPWMELETLIMSKVSHKEKDKYHMISLISGI